MTTSPRAERPPVDGVPHKTARPHDPPRDVRVTVASVPASHVYVRHIAAREDDGVRRLAEPEPAVAGRFAGRAWPRVMLDPGWVTSTEFDVFHMHFGFDRCQPDELAAVVDAVHATGRHFVQTVHELRSPYDSAELYEAQLATLLERADEVITLTPGAAAEIQRRWGRKALVLPHPHVVDLTTMRALQVARAQYRRLRARAFRVGLHLENVRAGMDPMAVLPTLLEAVEEIPAGTLQVTGHRDVLHPHGARYQRELARFLLEANARERLDLRVHDSTSDPDLWASLFSLDVSVLPYRVGSHSGFLEACRDLGTAVIAPSCGFYAEQGLVHSYVMDEHRFDAESLRRAVHEAYVAGPAPPVRMEDRIRQRDELAAAHQKLYLHLVGRNPQSDGSMPAAPTGTAGVR